MYEAAVVDASPLIVLSRAGHLDLLQVPDCPVVVPSAVVKEVEERGNLDVTVKALRNADFRVVTPADIPPSLARWNLGAGESAVLAVTGAQAAEFGRLRQDAENQEVVAVRMTWAEQMKAEGLEKGLEAGRQKGLEEGLNVGMAEGTRP